MAKVGFWLKGARGKFAGAVLQKGENGTISRENVTPANPRTRKQMIQRTVVKTVSAAGAQMKQLISESFEGLSPKEAVRQFQRENITILRQNLANDIANNRTGSDLTAFFLPKQVSKMPTPNQYLIAEGSLPARNYGPRAHLVEYTDDDKVYYFPAYVFDGACPCTVVGSQGAITAVKITVANLYKYFFGITSENQQMNLVTIGNMHKDTPLYGNKDIAAGAVMPQVFGTFRIVPLAGVDMTTELELTVTGETGNYHFIGGTEDLIMGVLDDAKTDQNALNCILAAINKTGLNIMNDSVYVYADGTTSISRSLPVYGDRITDIGSTNSFGACTAAAIFISDKSGKVETTKMVVASPYVDADDANFGLDIETALASWEKSNLDFGGDGSFLEQGGEADTLPA